jgi:hypothetical protein
MALRFLAAGWLIIAACDIPRDNPLDPKNPDGSRPRKILVEAFVNLNTGYPYDGYMLDALDSLEAVYPDRIVIAEYHRNVQNALSPYSRAENEILYNHYIQAFPTGQKGVPDVFIDGTEARVQGASSKASAFFRLQEVLLPRVSDVSRFSIQIETGLAGNGITPKIIIARLGDSDAQNLLVKAVLVSQIDEAYLKRVVTSDAGQETIDELAHGEMRTIQFSPMSVDLSVSNDLIVIVCDGEENTVYQCEKIRVNRAIRAIIL